MKTRTIERRDLLKLIKAKSPNIPETLRVTPGLTLRWVGTAWVREKCSDDDIQLVDTKTKTRELPRPPYMTRREMREVAKKSNEATTEEIKHD